MSNSIVLYGSGTLRTLRVLWALKECSLAYKHVPFLPGSEFSSSAKYRDISLTGKIPSVEIDGITLNESAAICLYLFDKYNYDKGACSSSALDRAQLYQWCFYAMTELDSHTLYVLGKHGGQLRHLYGESKTAVKTAKEGFELQILKLDKQLADGREFVISNTFTAADILLGTCIESALRLCVDVPLDIPDNCIRYWENLKKKQSFIDAYAENYR